MRIVDLDILIGYLICTYRTIHTSIGGYMWPFSRISSLEKEVKVLKRHNSRLKDMICGSKVHLPDTECSKCGAIMMDTGEDVCARCRYEVGDE